MRRLKKSWNVETGRIERRMEKAGRPSVSLGVDTQGLSQVRWDSQGRKSNGLTSLRPAIHLKSSTFRDTNSKSFSNAVAARIESARLIFRCWRRAIALLAASSLTGSTFEE